MLVKAALLPNPLVVTPKTTVLEFCHNVLDSNQTTAAVIDGEKLSGMVSVSHVFKKILPHYVDMDSKLADVIREGYFEEKFAQLKQIPVETIMERNTRTLDPDDSVIKAIALFSTAEYKTLPVIDKGKFVGTITRRSVLRQVTRAAS